MININVSGRRQAHIRPLLAMAFVAMIGGISTALADTIFTENFSGYTGNEGSQIDKATWWPMEAVSQVGPVLVSMPFMP